MKTTKMTTVRTFLMSIQTHALSKTKVYSQENEQKLMIHFMKREFRPYQK